MAITRETLRLLRDMDLAVSETIDDVTRQLVEAFARGWDETVDALDQALSEIAAAGDGVTPTQIRRSQKISAAVLSIADQLDKLASQSVLVITDTLGQVMSAAVTAQAGLAGSQLPRTGPAWVFTEPDPNTLDAIIRRSAQQITAASRPLSDSATDAVRRQLVRGVSQAQHPTKVARQILRRTEGAFNGGLSRALTIARTELADAHRSAAQAWERTNVDTIKGWEWLASLSKTTCSACWVQHGSFHPVEEFGPAGHQNCLTAGAVVSGPRALASTTRWFDGEVIEIRTCGGRDLTVTPNHPILTTTGWVAAGDLRESHDLVCGTGIEGPSVVMRPDDHQMPALIEDVAESLGGTSPVRAVSVPTAAEDFHGDGAGSNVHVVRTDGLLRDHSQVPLAQPFRHLAFLLRRVVGQPCLARLPRSGSAKVRGQRASATPDRRLCRQHQPPILLRTPAMGEQAVRVGVASKSHSVRGQAPADYRAAHAETAGQRVDRFPRPVPTGDLLLGQRSLGQQTSAHMLGAQRDHVRSATPQVTFDQGGPQPLTAYAVPSRSSLAGFTGDVVTDRVLKLARRSFRGHVYNLQTATGWYLANGIVTHNCRCSRLPVTKTWRELGIDLDEPAALGLRDGQATFDALPQADQLAILGRARLDAYRAGAPWQSLSAERRSSEWRSSYGVPSVADVQAAIP